MLDVNRMTALNHSKVKCSEYESQILMNVENALGIKPKLKAKKWDTDKKGNFLYNVSEAKNNCHVGPNPMGEPGSILRDFYYTSAMSRAKSAIEHAFVHADSNRMVLHALDLLSLRLRAAKPVEDANAITLVFINIICQHDFLDRKRSGETLDKAVRCHQMRVHRAEKQVAAAAKEGKTLTVEQILEKQEEILQPTIVAAPIYEERIVDVDTDINDDSDLNEFDSFDESKEEESLERLAAKCSSSGVSAPNFLDFDEYSF